MLIKSISWLSIFILICSANSYVFALPKGFVYLSTIDPSIKQDIRYAGNNNFLGHPVTGYNAAECLLTKPTALALKAIQKKLNTSGLSLNVYDCYRPQRAVNELIAWSKKPNQQQMKAQFYPHVDKRDFFNLGYVAAKSGHSRGSTVDLTIVSLNGKQHIDMGTPFDYMDPLSHSESRNVSAVAAIHRKRLAMIMQQGGFVPYTKEWWHFTLKNEPYPNTYFNIPITPHRHGKNKNNS